MGGGALGNYVQNLNTRGAKLSRYVALSEKLIDRQVGKRC